MKNILIIAMVVFAVGYMFIVMSGKYDSIKAVNDQKAQQKSK